MAQRPVSLNRDQLAIAEIKKAVDKAARDAFKNELEMHPHLSGNLRLKANNFTYKPGKVNFHAFVDAALQAMLFPWPKAVLEKSQIEILREIQPNFPEAELNPNLWHRDLFPVAKRKAQTIIEGNMVKPVSIRKCKSLSAVRKLLQAEAFKKSAAQEYTATFTFTKDKLLVGKKFYKYIPRRNNYCVEVRVKTKTGSRNCWVRIDGLVGLVRGY